MFGRLCHRPICPCAIQLTSAERPVYDSTFSSSLCSRSARKTQVRSRKKTSERKKTRSAAGKKRLAAGKSCFRSGKKGQQKMPLRSGKNSKQQKKHLAAAQKHLCSRKNAFWRQREKTVRGGKKPVRGKKKTGRGRKKPSSRESSFATQKVAATEKIHFRNGKKQQPVISMCEASFTWISSHRISCWCLVRRLQLSLEKMLLQRLDSQQNHIWLSLTWESQCTSSQETTEETVQWGLQWPWLLKFGGEKSRQKLMSSAVAVSFLSCSQGRCRSEWSSRGTSRILWSSGAASHGLHQREPLQMLRSSWRTCWCKSARGDLLHLNVWEVPSWRKLYQKAGRAAWMMRREKNCSRDLALSIADQFCTRT